MKFQAIKGVRDILPPESALWSYVERKARETFTTYGFGEILLPVFELVDLFARSVGLGTDIVNKEMYVFDLHGSYALEYLQTNLSRYPQEFSFSQFVQMVEDFSKQIDIALETDRLQRTQENLAAVERVKNLCKEFLEQSEPADSANRSHQEDWPAETSSIAEKISESVEAIKFGYYVAMRPEATASVVRAYIEHGMHTLPGDVKLYYMGPMFRRERPQKGRYRQFYQIGAEVLGQSDNPGIDADVIEMVLVLIERCGLVGHTLYINSIGCRDCRPKYVELLRAALLKVKDELGPDSQRRIETNPLRVLDSKLESEQAVIENLPRIADHLCEACRKHFEMLQAMLFMRQIAYEVNWRLVRGLDYYMRTTFEITAPGLGSQNAVCGGGRYDGLVELLGGPPTKGIGFALGTDRLILALQEAGKGAASASGGLDAYVAWMGASAYPVAVRIARTLRDAGFSVEMPHEEAKFKKSLGLAARLNARFAVILGDNEVAAGTATVKRMADGTQQSVAEKDLAAHLRS